MMQRTQAVCVTVCLDLQFVCFGFTVFFICSEIPLDMYGK